MCFKNTPNIYSYTFTAKKYDLKFAMNLVVQLTEHCDTPFYPVTFRFICGYIYRHNIVRGMSCCRQCPSSFTCFIHRTPVRVIVRYVNVFPYRDGSINYYHLPSRNQYVHRIMSIVHYAPGLTQIVGMVS